MAKIDTTGSRSRRPVLALTAGLLVVLTLSSTLVWRWIGTAAGVPTWKLSIAVTVGILAGAFYLLWLFQLYRPAIYPRNILVMVVVTGALMRLMTIPPAPGLEDDYHRYLWDGGVAAAGTNPYRYSPEDVLLGVRGDTQVDERLVDLAQQDPGELEQINHPHLRTIYPPVAQAWFALAHTIQPWSYNAWRGVILLHDLATLFLLLNVLTAIGLPAVWVAVYWLNPILIKELYLSAHMDVLAFPWVLAAIRLAIGVHMLPALALLAVAASVKLWPLLLAPVLLRGALRRPIRLLAGVAVFSVILFTLMSPMILHEQSPHSGLMRYAEAWQNNAGFFALHSHFWTWLLPRIGYEAWHAPQVVRYTTFGLVALWLTLLSIPPLRGAEDLGRRALWAVAGAFLIGPTQFPWYYTWLVPLLVIQPVWPLLLYTATMPLYYLQYRYPWVLWVEHAPIWMALCVYAWRHAGRHRFAIMKPCSTRPVETVERADVV